MGKSKIESDPLVRDMKSELLASGYYRVVYDPPNYALLRDQLVADHEVISSKNRVQLLDDAFNVALYGRINYTSALDLTLYLSKEQSYSPWHGILPELDYIHFMLINRGAFSDWQVHDSPS